LKVSIEEGVAQSNARVRDEDVNGPTELLSCVIKPIDAFDCRKISFNRDNVSASRFEICGSVIYARLVGCDCDIEVIGGANLRQFEPNAG